MIKLIEKMYFYLILILCITCSQTNETNENEFDQESIDEFQDSQNFIGSDQCSPEEIINQMADIFIPDDYQEGKENVKSKFESFNETLKSINRLQEYSHNVSLKMGEITKRLNSRLSEALMTIDLPTDCMSSLIRIMSAAKNGELWALKFFDAQPRLNNGLFEATGLPFGNYDQCLSIESPDEENKPKILGQYCGFDVRQYLFTDASTYPQWLDVFSFADSDYILAKIFKQMISNMMRTVRKRTKDDWESVVNFMDSNIYKKTKGVNGICLPTTCSTKDISQAINKIFYPFTRWPTIIDEDCEYIGKPILLNNFHIVSIIGLSCVFLVFIFCSVIDYLSKSSKIKKIFKNNSLEFYVICFSIKTNLKTLYSLKQYDKYKSLDGFKAILTFYVVLLHNYEIGLFAFFNKNHFLSASYKMTQDFRNMFLPNILLMDNFLLVSGFLLGNMILSSLERNKGKFNYINYLLYRYLRFLPLIICALGLQFLFELIGDGPVWNTVNLYYTKPCYDKWHKPLLMYNNMVYYPNENSTILSSIQCLTITWYASMEFQLYAISPIVFLILYKSHKYGLLWSLFVLFLSIVVPVFNRVVLDLPHLYESVSHPNLEQIMLGFSISYWGPINYLQTYIIGILVAYAVRRKPDVYLGGRIGELSIWIITIFMSFTTLYYQKNFTVPGYQYERFNGLELPIYLVFHKIMYLSGFSWLIFACVTGRGGFVNNILSWKGFKVIDNVILEIYVLHIFAFVYRMGVMRDQITFTDYYIWTSAVFDFVATYFMAITVALVVTRPFANIVNGLLRQKKIR